MDNQINDRCLVIPASCLHHTCPKIGHEDSRGVRVYNQSEPGNTSRQNTWQQNSKQQFKMSAFINLVCSGDVFKIKEYLEDPLNEIADPQIFINERDKSGKNALDFAGMLGREDVMRVLIECGADPNSSANRGL